MNWALELWADDEFVYVHSGLGFDELAFYRVPRRAFDRAIAAFRAGVTV